VQGHASFQGAARELSAQVVKMQVADARPAQREAPSRLDAADPLADLVAEDERFGWLTVGAVLAHHEDGKKPRRDGDRPQLTGLGLRWW
jgi:hypothetical protein